MKASTSDKRACLLEHVYTTSMSQGVKGLFLLEQHRLLLEFPPKSFKVVGVVWVLCSSEDVVRGLRRMQVGKHEGRDGNDTISLAFIPPSRQTNK